MKTRVSQALLALFFISGLAQATRVGVIADDYWVSRLPKSRFSCSDSTLDDAKISFNEWTFSMPLEKGGSYKIYGWGLQPKKSRGTIVLVHGLKDHSRRYLKMACEEWAAAGYSVFAFDQPHHGRSVQEGESTPSGEIESIEDFVGVLSNFTHFVRNRTSSDKPLIIFGHSMGGLVAASYAFGVYENVPKPEADGLILSGPALDFFDGFFAKLQVLLTKISPRFTPNFLIPDFLKNKFFSHEPGYVEMLEADPYIRSGKHSIRTAKALVQGISDFQASIKSRLANPSANEMKVLLLHGQADRITNPLGSFELQAKLAQNKIPADLHVWEGFFHDIFNEAAQVSSHQDLGRADVHESCDAWLEKNFK